MAGLMYPGGDSKKKIQEQVYRKINLVSYHPSSGAYINSSSSDISGRRMARLTTGYGHQDDYIEGIRIHWNGDKWELFNSNSRKVRVLSGVSGAPKDVSAGGTILSQKYTTSFNVTIEKNYEK